MSRSMAKTAIPLKIRSPNLRTRLGLRDSPKPESAAPVLVFETVRSLNLRTRLGRQRIRWSD
jgi:hypothetical protein